MALFKCKMCGGDLEILEGVTVAECEYCGTKQTVPKVVDENVQNLFNRANTLRIKSEFDKAEKLYEKIIQADETQADAYWGLILCKYGIEYVDDPATFKKVPTCHRASYDSVIADDDYKSALEHADMSQRAIYEEQAKEIDRIQKEILALAQKEETYDVFICYKETDANGQRTQDSVIANDIYYQLTNEGFKVFYAAITLEGKLGSAYEPIIFAALNSAKVMLTIGTKPEYFNAVWVKNEWSRFLKIIKNDRSKLLIPCYRDMDAYELPEEFAHLQAQDMSKIGFINDVVRGIKKVIAKDEPQATVVKETVVTNAPATNIAPLLERAFIFLEDGEWDNANEYCEKVLDIDPKCAEAYLVKLMVENKTRHPEHLKDCSMPFDDSNNYKKAARFADEKLRSTLFNYVEHIKTRNENTRLEALYDKATIKMATAKSESDYIEAKRIFLTLVQYKDSPQLAQECGEKAEAARKDTILDKAKSKMFGSHVVQYEEAIKLFESISGWKSADENVRICQEKIEEIKAKAEADRLEKERKAEIARAEAKKRSKRNKKIAIIGTPIFCAIIAFFIVLKTVIIPNNKYNDAIALMKAGKYEVAFSAFEKLDGFKDSAEKMDECKSAIIEQTYTEAVALLEEGKHDQAFITLVGLGDYKDSANRITTVRNDKLKSASVGDCIFLGAYEQDNITYNGKEAIEWLVLEKEDNKLFVISKSILECKPLNTYNTSVTWETCTLRGWLNNEFVNTTFSACEKALIPTVTVSADKIEYYDTQPGNSTQDKIFVLSVTEFHEYEQLLETIGWSITDYVSAHGLYYYGESWLRTPGESQDQFATLFKSVDSIGCYGNGCPVDMGYGVRPAMWIDLQNIK